MKRITFTALFFIATLTHAFCQSADEQQAKDVVVKLFDGMAKGDTAAMRKFLAHNVTMATVSRDKSGNPVLTRESSTAAWLKAVGTPRKDALYEEVWDLKVQLDGDFATVWCDYALYIGNAFHHCGVDAFHLHKQKDGWKIFHVSDTRRTVPCNVPANIQQKHQ